MSIYIINYHIAIEGAMKTEYPFLFSFLYNWAADYILLLFVKKDLYPEIKNRTILIGASAVPSLIFCGKDSREIAPVL